MVGWGYLIAAAVCLSGVLVFLRTVACAVDAVDGSLRALEEKRRRDRRAAETA